MHTIPVPIAWRFHLVGRFTRYFTCRCYDWLYSTPTFTQRLLTITDRCLISSTVKRSTRSIRYWTIREASATASTWSNGGAIQSQMPPGNPSFLCVMPPTLYYTMRVCWKGKVSGQDFFRGRIVSWARWIFFFSYLLYLGGVERSTPCTIRSPFLMLERLPWSPGLHMNIRILARSCAFPRSLECSHDHIHSHNHVQLPQS
jgi:hypothetical protein